jgi:hypothetical protein
LDGWTSRFQDCFVCITAHWISQTWEYKEIVLGFEHILGSHTGEALKDIFVEVMERYGLQRKILAITTDNASNVKKMMSLLQGHTKNNPDEW